MSTDNEIPTIDPEIEPEYVGAHSAVTNDRCQNWIGETTDDVSQCEREATHTVVMKDASGLKEIAMCDECGEPQDVTATARKWSG